MSVITVHEPREVLAYVPYALGFQPTDSIAVVSLRGDTNRIGLVARVDIDAAHEMAPALATHLVTDGATVVFVIAYTDTLMESHTAARTVTDALRAAGIDRTAAWWVNATGYRQIDPTNPAAWQAQRPLTDLDATIVAATMVTGGATIQADRNHLAPIPAPPADRDQAAAARDTYTQRTPTGDLTAHQSAGLDLWRETITTSRYTPTQAGHLAAALTDVTVRDAVLVTLLPGGRTIADDVITNPDTGTVSAALGRVFDPHTGTRPDEATTGPARDLLTCIIAHVDSPAALTLAAFLAWWDGNGAGANIHLDAAQAIDPNYRLAVLLRHALDAGLPPGWVRATR